MGSDKTVVRGKMEIAGIMGPIWFMGWLFTIGFADLSFIRAVWAVALWPYYLGSVLAA